MTRSQPLVLAALLAAAAVSAASSAEFSALSKGLPELPPGIVPPVAGRPVPFFEEQPVSIPTDDGSLTGKIALPRRLTALTPAIVLVHGSGKADMDETVAASDTFTQRPTKIFKDLSDRLAAAGFVVLRYDKRGVTGWDGEKDEPVVDEHEYAKDTAERLADDAAAAVRFLRAGRSARRPVIVLGHSEGTRLAPMVAARTRVDGLILLGAMADRLDVILHYQLVQRQVELIRDRFDADRDGVLTKEEAMADIGTFLLYVVTDVDKRGRVPVPEIERYLEDQYAHYGSQHAGDAWYQSHLRLPPNTRALAAFRGPVLIAQGETDVQTPLDQARELEAALRASGHPDFTVKTFPGLGHGFAPPRDGWIPTIGPIEPAVLDYVAAWAAARWR